MAADFNIAMTEIRGALTGAGLIEAPVDDFSMEDVGSHTIDNRFLLAGIGGVKQWRDMHGNKEPRAMQTLLEIQVAVAVKKQNRNTAIGALTNLAAKVINTLLPFNSVSTKAVFRAGEVALASVQDKDDRLLAIIPFRVVYT